MAGDLSLPALKPLFRRLVELHPDWEWAIGPCYKPDGISHWALDVVCRDADWMPAHLALHKHVIITIAGLGWSYNWQYSNSPRPLMERWAEVERGRMVYGTDYDPDTGEEFDTEDWESFGPPHRASGPTDLHALLGALIAALEAHQSWQQGTVVAADG